ncbi:MAG: methylmalonyl Co-A mutase-associated GTPase MeaB [Myxococcota bacterium]|nr:methylmalonyl Co-A mutase-associated GTPase MeaB [Myxococcota bacterium]
MPKRLSVAQYEQGVRKGDRSVLARAITLVESRKKSDQILAQALLNQILPHTGKAIRIGISGLPGVGKSTLLDLLGMKLIEQGMSVAVLAIDPSSTLRGGSILGDKTRMQNLSLHPNAFIRPTASDTTLGGVARKTREALFLCEAAGFDVVIVETVGVGQSEITVSHMVDCFVALMLPGGGDELQGIKKGVLEVADIIAINKADAERIPLARATLREHRAALRYLRPKNNHWKPQAIAISAITGSGVDDLWALICEHRNVLEESHHLSLLRQTQRKRWMWDLIRESLLEKFQQHPDVKTSLETTEESVAHGLQTATTAAQTLLDLFAKK